MFSTSKFDIRYSFTTSKLIIVIQPHYLISTFDIIIQHSTLKINIRLLHLTLAFGINIQTCIQYTKFDLTQSTQPQKTILHLHSTPIFNLKHWNATFDIIIRHSISVFDFHIQHRHLKLSIVIDFNNEIILLLTLTF